jgi:hypothetical protein
MAQSEYTFPQDFGTGLAYSGQSGDTGDNNDAARFGALVGATQPVSCIINGLTFSNVDFTNLTVAVDSGKFYAVADDVGVATANESRDGVAHVNGHTGTTGLSLTDSAVNHVYAYADLDVKDDVKIAINTTNTSPSYPSVKIGEIDTTDNTVSEQWNLLTEDGTLSYPNADAANTALQSLPTGVTVIDRSNDVRITDGNLNANGAVIGGIEIPEQISDTRNAVNQLFIDNARQDFELGLNIINMDDGQFEIYANNNRIADSSNVSLSLGSPLNGKGTVSLVSSATSGFTEHIIEDFDFRPNTVVVTDDLETNPQNGTVTYEIEDENGNIVTIPRSQLNQSVDISNTIETYAVTTRAVLERNSTTNTSPVLDAYSVYVSGQKPDDYLDARVTGVSEV